MCDTDKFQGNSFKKACHRLIYLPTGEFSITRIIMILVFMFAISVGVIGLLAYLIYDKTLPTNIYTYAFQLAGGGLVQYGLTKGVSAVKEKNASK